MIIYLSRISMRLKKKEPKGTQVLNRPPKMKGVVAKPKYVAPVNWDVILFETTTRSAETVMEDEKHYIWRGIKEKKLTGKPADYEIVKVEHIREIGVTVDHYKTHEKPVEVLRPWENKWPGEDGFVKNYKPEKKKEPEEKPVYNFPPVKFSK